MTCYSAFLSVFHGSKSYAQRCERHLVARMKLNFEPMVEIDLENYYYEKYQIKAHCCNIENNHWKQSVVGWEFFKEFIWYRCIEFIQWFQPAIIFFVMKSIFISILNIYHYLNKQSTCNQLIGKTYKWNKSSERKHPSNVNEFFRFEKTFWWFQRTQVQCH